MKPDFSFDQLIKETVDEELNKVPGPSVPKKEAWKNIQKELEGRETTNRRNIKGIAIAASVFVTILTFSLFQSQSGMAFEWLTKHLIQVQGNVTQLFGRTGESPRGENPPPAEEFTIIETNTRQEKMTLSEAQDRSKFRILMPQRIPEGFHLDHVLVTLVDDEPSREVELHYTNSDEKLLIKEYYVEYQMGYGITVDNEDTKVKPVSINGHEGTIFLFQNGENKLIWDAGQVHFEVETTLPENEIIKLAESIK